jgi:hypothetical protein
MRPPSQVAVTRNRDGPPNLQNEQPFRLLLPTDTDESVRCSVPLQVFSVEKEAPHPMDAALSGLNAGDDWNRPISVGFSC